MIRPRLRRLGYGLSTLLGGKARGWFLPYRYAADSPPPALYPEVEAVFRRAGPSFADMFDRIDVYEAPLRAIGGEPPPAPRWTQDWFPRLDAAAAYALVRDRRPRRIVEIGSGHSTRFLARAVSDGRLATQIVAVDPAPRAVIAGLPVAYRRSTLQSALVEAPLLFDFGPDDMLFVDSSHLLMPGSDVDLLLNRLVPRLPAGAVLHIHDVFLPHAYPSAWAWRGYNEQNAVAPLLACGAFEPLFASRWAVTRMAPRLARSFVSRLPLAAGAWETSLWLRRC